MMCQNILKFILLIKISKQFKRHISVLSERSHSLLQEIFLTQGSNPSFLHCRQILYCLSRQRSPVCRKKYSETRNLEMKLPPHIYKNPRFRWHALFCISVDALWEESFVFSVFHLLKLLGLPINLCKTLWKKKREQIWGRTASCFEHVFVLVHCTLVHLCYDRVPRGGESEGPRSESEGSPCAGTLLPA